MKTAVITGVTGHVGRELGRQLASLGVRVHGISRRDIPFDHDLLPGVQFHRYDGSGESLVDALERSRSDVVFHLAAMPCRDHSVADVSPLVDANVRFGAQMLEAMRVAGVPNIITAGTYLQHGDSERYRALNLCAATKQAFEALLEFYCDAFPMRGMRLTCCNVYGEGNARPSLIGDIARAFREDIPLQLRDGEARVDPVHVEDVAAAFVCAWSAIEHESSRLTRYSISSGSDISANELVKLFERISGRLAIVHALPSAHTPRRMRPWRGLPVPGWRPHIDLNEGLARLLAFDHVPGSSPNNEQLRVRA